MKIRYILAGLLLPVMFLSGCATNVSTLEPDLSMCAGQNNATETAQTVFIKNVTDERVFAANARADMPTWSNDGSYEEERAIGRKRNGFGKAMGGLVLPEGMPATSVVKEVLTQAFSDNGYRVVKQETEVTDETRVVNVKMPKFWSWMTPGFWQIHLSSNIEADVSGFNKEAVKIKGRYTEGFQTGVESNWLTVLNQAIKNFYEDAKAKLK